MHYDAIIIGGSYAGLSAALQLARARRTVCVIDAGRPRNRFADASHGFFGHDGAQPKEMIGQARTQLLAYPSITFIQGEAIAARQGDGAGFVVELGSGEAVAAHNLILTHGVEDILPDLPGLAERWGRSVLHCPYCHGYEFGGRRLGVLNVMPMSIHQALLIPEWGPTTFFLNGADTPEDTELEKLRKQNVVVEPAPVVGLEGDAPALAGVRLVDGQFVEIDALFIAPTTRLNSLAEQLGCAIDEGPMGPIIRTDEMKMTTVPGVYAAGDAAMMMSNVTLASADGVFAGLSLHRSLVFSPLD